MKDKFSTGELATLRKDLLQGTDIDSRGAADLLQAFVTERGYGASPEAALDAVARVEMSRCSMSVLRREIEGLALAM